MFDGKTFFPVTGMPMRKMACISKLLALAEPVPFTVPILKAKALTRDSTEFLPPPSTSGILHHRLRRGHRELRYHGAHMRRGPPCRIKDEKIELSHVPRCRGASFGAQPAVQADVFVLHHYALRLRQRRLRGQRLRLIYSRRRETRAEV